MILLKTKPILPYSQMRGRKYLKLTLSYDPHNSLRSISSATESILKGFKSIWESGRTPDRFNFSRDVFDKHAVSFSVPPSKGKRVD